MEASRIVNETTIFYMVRQSIDSYIHGVHKYSIHYKRAITTTLIRKTHTIFPLTCVYTLCSLSVFPLTEPHTWVPHRGDPLDLLEPHTWVPHRGHLPGSPGTAHMGSSSESPARIYWNRTLGFLIGATSQILPGPPARRLSCSTRALSL
ncbi:hypothetical protein ACOSQ2_011674 [Xanthoceras sorbifolium]